MEKAFDRVKHEILAAKLVDLGVNPLLVLWISEYLRERKHYTRIRGQCSEILEVKSVVPQGSLLSPVLFKLYLLDLFDLIENSRVYAFADDVKLLGLHKDFAKTKLDLETLCGWGEKVGLKVNSDKCGLIHFGPVWYPPGLEFQGKTIPSRDVQRFGSVY